MPHAGLEILAGILLARLNNWPVPSDRCSCKDCLEKRHGRTHRSQSQKVDNQSRGTRGEGARWVQSPESVGGKV